MRLHYNLHHVEMGYMSASFRSSRRTVCAASSYGPHVKSGNPWFEGWYTRVITTSEQSFGVLLGHYPAQQLADPSYCTAIFHQPKGLAGFRVATCYPQSMPSIEDRAVSDGKADATFSVRSTDGSCSWDMRGDTFSMRVTAQGVELMIEGLGSDVPWGLHGAKPEGWAHYLPFLGLHWCVHSLATPVSWMYKDDSTGTFQTGFGFAHMEKDWGEAFPDAWIWAQGMKLSQETDTTPEVIFALAGGREPLKGLSASAISLLPDTFLVGYRSCGLVWNFHPQDPTVYRIQKDAKEGKFNITAIGLNKCLIVRISAPAASFTNVACPTREGFKPDSMETYAGTARILAYERHLMRAQRGWELIEEHVVHNVALEFGGAYQSRP